MSELEECANNFYKYRINIAGRITNRRACKVACRTDVFLSIFMDILIGFNRKEKKRSYSR